ncbi:hypothetical protein BATDEDRAFT_86023 [Batrachochytrium dendrobatidis JAM81]|uniref:Acid phosphatase n=2 Tax=Batrachochytrium dendrobatidis TaxID=109871 RepID=F4NUH7_BATDJ|nr:uncharacterized protein BATDEDRAFT_86023 [Batrachochytrium dendrobatidis JAM81]EGF83608.1 hypothetical protein BATDEDRAFT_86023 [Batrachochytrium dendrobatidis JAM81]KAJ8327323.1 hypothetical protein O5D80_004722 [Batrachochytrium dendrobatidis]KAK5665292.1 hypothetical protein QVD99_008126 [Batrachochytrium dendrobatidis]OAJ37450.1 hypothetical protein BDEG_21467 [Batrachochytrium dendrobatidis JEL423]|eukprot:XP_006676155.1 hypothetical protein BATDEDRAFT_86023 [Batrachochytrium dendrobatidis JAM81]
MLLNFVSAAIATTAAISTLVLAESTTFDRFFVIVLENTNYSDAMADTYLGTTLAEKGRLLTSYSAIRHPSQPNYLAMISGSTQGNKNDKNVNVNSNTIVDLLETGGISWGSYQESYPGRCSTATSSGTYRRKHNPFISFTNIAKDPARCAKIVPATQLNKDIAKNSVPSYVFYTPDMNNDGHDTDVSYASNWLEGFLEPLLTKPIFSNTVFLITFDEDASDSNQVYAMLVGGPAAPGTTDSNSYNHYSQLATVEANWNLGNLGQGDASASAFTFA